VSFPAVRCVFDHLAPKVRGPVQHVLLWLANHAHDDGSGIWAAQQTIADEAGMNRRTVQRAIDALLAAGLVVIEGRYKRGVNLVRIVLCPLCATETHKALYASESRSTRVRESHKPVKNHALLTQVQRLAMQAEKLKLRNGTHTPNGDGRAGTERSVPGHPPAVLGGKAAEDPASPNDEDDHGTTPGTPGEPWDQGNPSTNPGNLIPFKARPSDPGTPRGAARTQSGEVTRDSMGGAVLRPTADLEDDDAFWTAGEEAVWQLAQEMRQESAELPGLAEVRDPRRFMR
jgi:hypothetical protein